MERPKITEIVLVISLISVMAAILFPVFSKVREGGGPYSSCQGNMKQIGLCLMEYAQDNNGYLPPVSDQPGRHSWRTAIGPYTQNAKRLFFCPTRGSWSDAKNGPAASDGYPISYAVNTAGVGRSGLNRGPFAPTATPQPVSKVAHPEWTIAVCEVQKTASAGFDIDDPFFGPKRQVLYAISGYTNVVFLDSHVKALHPAGTAQHVIPGQALPLNLWYENGHIPLTPNGMAILAKTEATFKDPTTQ